MAGWLSSKLKEAEQFLQQIDQQAAESLGKPEIQKPNDRGGRHGKTKPTTDLLYADQKDGFREASARGKVDLGLEAAPLALSKLVKKSDQGPKAVNGNGRFEDPSLYKKQQQAPIIQIAGESEVNGKDDWTELLASPNVDLFATPALASSVGSSDSGRSGYVKGHTSRATVNRNKIGGYHWRSDDISLEKSSVAKPELSVTSKISPSVFFSKTGSVNSSKTGSVNTSKTVLPGRFGDEALPRRLELDLAELAGAEAEERSEALVSAISKNTATNGGGVDFNRAVIERSPDSENSRHMPEVFLKETAKEDGADEAKPSENQTEGPSNLWEQAGKSPGLALDSKGNLAEVNQSMVLLTDNEHNETKSIDSTVEDTFEGAHGIEKQTNAIQNLLDENGRSVATDTHQVVEGRDLAAAHERGNLESLPVTRALSVPLKLDDESDNSSSMSDGDSDRETESEDEEDEEMERRKFAHKKRIARRKELTAARAAAAQAAIRECELFVEKLEKEAIALKRVLAEREEQQGREAAELRTTIAEVMHALETEKKVHSSTRLKALAVESQLENENAELAKSLGALQWELDEQTKQVLKARNMINSKEVVKAELERRLAKMRGQLYCEQNGEPKIAEKSKDEDCSFEEEQSDLWKKIQQCQIQVKDLEVKIQGLKDTRRVPTEIEQELENRLAQMTDYLIQKQAQVEAVATEKATLLIRLEALSNTINEERAMASSQAARNKLGGRRSSDWDYYDMEYGLSSSYDSKSKHSAYELGESSTTVNSMGSVPLSPVLRQLNGFFSAGIFFLRKHRWAQVFAIMYIIILHLWVWFVVSKPTQTLALHEFGLPKNVSELKDGSNVTNLL